MLIQKVYAIELCAYLGGLEAHKSSSSALFMTIEEVGNFLDSMDILLFGWMDRF